MLSTTADVVIIGGGVNGLSTAYHLARRGCTDVVVLEKEKLLASGATGLSVGGIRQQYSTEVNVRMATYAVRQFERFAETMDADIGFRQVGYLFLLTTESEVATFRDSFAWQRRLGVPVEWLERAEVAARWPHLHTDDVRAATFCPTDGYADPYAVAHAYAAAARRRGVRILTDTAATGIVLEGGAVRAVETNRGQIATPTAVNVAGPHGHLVARWVGIELPIRPYRRQVLATEPFPLLPHDLPMTIDFTQSWYFRPEGEGFVVGMSDPGEPSSFSLLVDQRFLERIIEHGMYRVPVLGQARVKRGWAGLYDVSPDDQPVMGRIPGVEGFVCAVGFSGHGFMLSPATGLTLSEVILDGAAHTFDISDFRYERFATGDMAEEKHVI